MQLSNVVDAWRLPNSVTAVTQQLKNDATYSRVDNEATMILTYANAQAIIQGSWNWPDHRKDLEIFGTHGYVFTPDATNVRMRLRGEPAERSVAHRIRQELQQLLRLFGRSRSWRVASCRD